MLETRLVQIRPPKRPSASVPPILLLYRLLCGLSFAILLKSFEIPRGSRSFQAGFPFEASEENQWSDQRAGEEESPNQPENHLGRSTDAG